MEVPTGEGEPWKVLEFYSGIGGMRYSLLKSGVRFEVVEAFDINDKANDVYEFNFGHRPYQGNIQCLTAMDLDKYGADAWLMSPPCQPYTRQGLQKDSGDARASSFLKLLSLIKIMLRPPLFLFVENVVGFEASDTHKQMIDIFSEMGFVSQEYILTPLQFGIPYSRPRYFCLAKRKPLSFQNPSFNNQLFWTPRPFQQREYTSHVDVGYNLDDSWENQRLACEPIQNFLDIKAFYESSPDDAATECSNDVNCPKVDYKMMFQQLSVVGSVSGEPKNLQAISLEETAMKGHGEALNYANTFVVPIELIERWGSVMDIVYPESPRCCCFTKSYYRYVKGTGSLLATLQHMDQHPAKRDTSSLKELGLRYFTPREVANLHSFPKDFRFPDHIHLRQQYALLGNSISVAVVGPLLQYLFSESCS